MPFLSYGWDTENLRLAPFTHSSEKECNVEMNELAETLNYEPFAELPIAREIVRHFMAGSGIKPDDTVLDIGCGTGDSAGAILEMLKTSGGWEGRIVAIDPDPVSLAIARERLTGCPVEFHQCTAQGLDQLGFAEETFDVSVWSNGIHYVNSPDLLAQALRNIRFLTKNGFVAWSSFVREAYVGKTIRFSGLWVGKACELLGVNPKERVKSENLQERGAAEYVAALNAAGFSRIEQRLKTFDLPPEVYESISRFSDYAENAFPAIPARPDLTLPIRSRALFSAVRMIYERLGVETLPRNWLYLQAEV